MPTESGMTKYLSSLSSEFDAMKDKVRYLIHDSNWQKDGEWKEVVLRKILKRYSPATIGIGTGFVVGRRTITENYDDIQKTGQIDVLIYDHRAPKMFSDGDFVIIPPYSVIGIIEVKSRVRSIGHFKEAVSQLAQRAEYVAENIGNIVNLNSLLSTNHASTYRRDDVFVGLFVYDMDIPVNRENIGCFLQILSDASRNNMRYAINHVVIGDSIFIKLWKTSPSGNRGQNVPEWQAYELVRLARGYFVHNAVQYMVPNQITWDENLWYPVEGKGLHLLARQSLI